MRRGESGTAIVEMAILGTLERRDSLVVMPTGGGKSLCYQVPPLVHDDLTVVVVRVVPSAGA